MVPRNGRGERQKNGRGDAGTRRHGEGDRGRKTDAETRGRGEGDRAEGETGEKEGRGDRDYVSVFPRRRVSVSNRLRFS